MRFLRTALATGVMIALAFGYAASQLAFWSGLAREWASAVDQPAIAWIALFVLILAIAFGAMSDRDMSVDNE